MDNDGKKDKLEFGLVDGEMAEKVAKFSAKVILISQEQGLTVGEMSVALDILKSFLEEQGVHTGIIKQEKKKE